MSKVPEERVLGGMQVKKAAPGPRGYPFVGILLQMRRDPLGFLSEAARRYGDVVSLKMGPMQAYLLSHPDHIQHVLQDHHRNYRKSRFVERVKPFLGEGLATSEGETWKRQRRLAQPAFHRQQIAALARVVTQTVEESLEQWRMSTAAPIDMLRRMMMLTGDIILRTMFGASGRDLGRSLLDDFDTVTHYCMDRMLATVDWNAVFPTPGRRRFRAAMGRLDQAVHEIITSRRRRDEERGDLLSMLLLARDGESGEQMTDRQLRDEVMTMFFAGHETTGLALTWSWYLLSQHPEAERRLHQELAEVLQGRPPTFDDLPRLTYTRMVIEESMRLYPPSWIISRAPICDDVIGGVRIPSGTTVFLSQYVTHRHPKLWDDPERFDPERFASDRVPDRPRFAYFPFSGGPRQCLGEQFAMMEAQLVLAGIAQACRLRLVPGHPIEAQPLLTLRPRGGLPMIVEPRPNSA